MLQIQEKADSSYLAETLEGAVRPAHYGRKDGVPDLGVQEVDDDDRHPDGGDRSRIVVACEGSHRIVSDR